jgi:F-type H+-transporting ATPase subunit c
MRPQLMVNTFIFAGLMESFPFIILAFGFWFLFANPFLG